MKRNLEPTVIWGALLIGAGLLFLLQNLGIFGAISALLWTAILGGAGLTFLYVFLSNTETSWWAAIPGMTLLGLAAAAFLDRFAPFGLEAISGAFFLAAIGAGFILVYLVKPQNWWAIIPAGVMATLAVVAGSEEIGPRGFDTGGVFFIGLGLTFLALTLLPGRRTKLRWAYIPGSILLVMGILIGISSSDILGVLVALALIVGGFYVIARNAGWRGAGLQAKERELPSDK